MSNPFDFIKGLNEKSSYMNSFNEEDYSPFLTNRNFSLFDDTIFYANQMNLYPNLPKNMQHDYYFYSIAKRKRFAKWPKKDKLTSENIALMMSYYKYNAIKAKAALLLLTDDQIEQIKIRNNKGES